MATETIRRKVVKHKRYTTCRYPDHVFHSQPINARTGQPFTRPFSLFQTCWENTAMSRSELLKAMWRETLANSGATDIVLVTLSSTAVERAIVQCTSRWAMARGHRLNTSIVLAAVHGLSGLFRAVSAVEPFTLSSPSHSVPVPNRPSRLRGR